MKYAFAIVLLCIPTTLSAGEHCPKAHANRTEIVRSPTVKLIANRTEATRPQKIRTLTPWQRAVLLEPQIL